MFRRKPTRYVCFHRSKRGLSGRSFSTDSRYGHTFIRVFRGSPGNRKIVESFLLPQRLNGLYIINYYYYYYHESTAKVNVRVKHTMLKPQNPSRVPENV